MVDNLPPQCDTSVYRKSDVLNFIREAWDKTPDDHAHKPVLMRAFWWIDRNAVDLDSLEASETQKMAALTEAGLIHVRDANHLVSYLKSLKNHFCSICNQPGHIKGFCWLNGMLWHLARNDGNSMSNYKYRQGLKVMEEIASEEEKAKSRKA